MGINICLQIKKYEMRNIFYFFKILFNSFKLNIICEEILFSNSLSKKNNLKVLNTITLDASRNVVHKYS